MVSKSALRKTIISNRAGNQPHKNLRLKDLPDVVPGSIIAVYESSITEPDTSGIIKELQNLDVRIAIPDPANHWKNHHFIDFAAGSEIPVQDIDLFIVPALGADKNGNRLGRGGGWYDRALSAGLKPSAQIIAVIFESEFFDSLPSEPHDVPVNKVIRL